MKKAAASLIMIALAFAAPGCGQKDEPGSAAVAPAKEEIVIHVDAARAAELLESDEEIRVLDVRRADEYEEGHLAGALHVDFSGKDFESKLAELDREVPYLVHCAGGGRSGKTLPILEKLGYQRVYHLDPGYSGWVAAGNPVEK